MAKTLSNSGIVTGQTIKASEVSQSIDALTGTEAYDITISGSLTVTGSTSIDGDVFINPTSANTGTAVLTINPVTGKIFRTGSYSTGGSATGSVGTLDQVTNNGSSTANNIGTGAIIAGGLISASGNLYADLANNSTTTFKTVVYDPSTGKFYRTGSFSGALTADDGKFDVGDNEIVFDVDGSGSGLKGDGSGSIELTGPNSGSGGKFDVTDGEIVFEGVGVGVEGVGIKGTGSKTLEVTDKDGNGGKLDIGGGDGNGEIKIGDSGDIRGGENKGKITPGTGDGEWEVLKENGTKGEISTNIKAGTNTTIIDDNIVLSYSSGYIVSTGSITTLSNFVGGGLELTPAAGGNGGSINMTSSHGFINLNASGSITASKDILAQNLNLSGGIIDLKNEGTQSEVKFYCESGNAHYTKIQAAAHAGYSGNKILTLPTFDFDFATPTFGTVAAPVNLDVTGIFSLPGITNVSASLAINTAKTGITAAQTSAITENTAKTSFPGFVDVALTGATTAESITVSGNLVGVNITASGDISGGNLDVTGNITASAGIKATSAHITTDLAVNGDSNFGVSSADKHNFIGHITASGNISASGDFAGTNITASGTISSSGNVFGNRIVASTYIQASTYVQAETLDIGTGSAAIDSTIISLPNIPTSDPAVAGRLWRDGTDLKISVG